MSAPTPAPGDDRPREGYYPDPSIPGYVRYWNGAAWVPGTSRPAPSGGEPLSSPADERSVPASTEETGPHFFDEDPPAASPSPADAQHGSRPEPATAWGADRSRQTGFGGDPDRRIRWGKPDPRVPAEQSAESAGPSLPSQPDGRSDHTDGMATFHSYESQADFDSGSGSGAAADGGSGTLKPPGSGGSVVFRRPTGPVPPTGAAGSAASGGAGGADMAAGQAGGAGAAGAMGAGRAHGSGADRSGGVPGSREPLASEGTMTFRPVPRGGRQRGSGPAAAQPSAAAQAAQAAAAQAQAASQGPAAAFPAAPATPQQSTPQQSAPGTPQQSTPGTPPQSGSGAPMAAGAGGGQPSWAQQVHRLAGPEGDQPVVPWKPVREDPFQAVARSQANARPAGLGKRFAARLVDTIVLAAVTGAAAVPLGTRALDHVNEKIDAAKLSGETVTVWLLDGTTAVYLGIILAVLLLFGVLYEALPTAKWGRTLGKKLCGLQVRDIEGGDPPSFGLALRRWLVYSVPGLLAIGVVGVLWGAFDRPWRQCWHDKAAHTFVAG
ncbi:RDD family protein [Streptomyces sp. NPDC058694]|uniref:RDD family protein n=1 Tax=Streptomyces sp. NPDC058694 TaxID=3346603 RepID=UPI003664352D